MHPMDAYTAHKAATQRDQGITPLTLPDKWKAYHIRFVPTPFGSIVKQYTPVTDINECFPLDTKHTQESGHGFKTMLLR